MENTFQPDSEVQDHFFGILQQKHFPHHYRYLHLTSFILDEITFRLTMNTFSTDSEQELDRNPVPVATL